MRREPRIDNRKFPYILATPPRKRAAIAIMTFIISVVCIIYELFGVMNIFHSSTQGASIILFVLHIAIIIISLLGCLAAMLSSVADYSLYLALKTYMNIGRWVLFIHFLINLSIISYGSLTQDHLSLIYMLLAGFGLSTLVFIIRIFPLLLTICLYPTHQLTPIYYQTI